MTKGPRTYLRGAHELHDFNLVTPGMEGQPDDCPDRERGRNDEHRPQRDADHPHHVHDGQQAIEPLTVVPDVGHPGRQPQFRGEAIGRRRSAGAGLEADFVRRGQRVRFERADRRRQIRKGLLEPDERLFLRHEFVAGDDPARLERELDARAIRGARLVVQIDRHFRGPAPFVAEPLEVRRGDQESAEDEQRDGNRAGGQQARRASPPQAGTRLLERIAHHPSGAHALSTRRPRSRVIAR